VLSNNIYKILNKYSRKIINLSAMSRDQTDTSRVCNILEHLARFRITKNIINEMSRTAFRESLDIRIKANGKAFGPREQIEVRHDSIVKLIIKNIEETTLYVHVYNLDPFWQIKEFLYASYKSILERNHNLDFKEKSSKKIRITIPSAIRGYSLCENIIKIFVTSQSTSFDSLELSNLDKIDSVNVEDRISRPSNYRSKDWVALNFPICTLL